MLNEIKERWQAYMDTGEISKEIRTDILESWHRCEKMKVDHMEGRGTKITDLELEESISKKKELIYLARPIMENVYEMIKNTSYSVVLTDENGVIVDLIINKDLKKSCKIEFCQRF